MVVVHVDGVLTLQMVGEACEAAIGGVRIGVSLFPRSATLSIPYFGKSVKVVVDVVLGIAVGVGQGIQLTVVVIVGIRYDGGASDGYMLK